MDIGDPTVGTLEAGCKKQKSNFSKNMYRKIDYIRVIYGNISLNKAE
jgi:hypothetical protein